MNIRVIIDKEEKELLLVHTGLAIMLSSIESCPDFHSLLYDHGRNDTLIVISSGSPKAADVVMIEITGPRDKRDRMINELEKKVSKGIISI